MTIVPVASAEVSATDGEATATCYDVKPDQVPPVVVHECPAASALD